MGWLSAGTRSKRDVGYRELGPQDAPKFVGLTPADYAAFRTTAASQFAPTADALKAALAQRGKDVMQSDLENFNARGISPTSGVFGQTYDKQIGNLTADEYAKEQAGINALTESLLNREQGNREMAYEGAMNTYNNALDAQQAKEEKKRRKRAAFGSALGAVGGSIAGFAVGGPAGAFKGAGTGADIGSNLANAY